MIRASFYFCIVLCVLFLKVTCQEYDFAAEMTRQCLVPDPVGLLDCVENKVTLPYMTSWVDCTNSLGQNVRTSADIINYRCKSVWEGKGLIPEVFYIKDCVIEKTGLPAPNVSAEVLGAYKECESTPSTPQQGIKTAPIQQQQLSVSRVEYNSPSQQTQLPILQPPQQSTQVQTPIQQVRAPALQPPQSQIQVQRPIQQVRAPVLQPPQSQIQIQRPIQQVRAPALQPPQSQIQVQRPIQQVRAPVFQPPQSQIQVQRPIQQVRAPVLQTPQSQFPVQRPVQQVQAPLVMPQQPFQMQIPFRQTQPAPIQPFQQAQIPYQQFQVPAPFQTPNSASRQQFQPQGPRVQQRPVQQQFSVAGPNQQSNSRPGQFNQQPKTATAFQPQYLSTASKPQYPPAVGSNVQRQPYSQQYFTIYPQAPLPNQQQNINRAVLSQKTVPSQPFLSQQLVAASTQDTSAILNAPYSYSYQIHHPSQVTF